MSLLRHEPYNLIITGVGGQGNVMASRVIGNMLSRLGLKVTIGETFGSSQRGGSVRSDLRISAQSPFSPQMPRGAAHMVVGMEPSETMRVLKDFGNPGVKVICNLRPIHSVNVICGEYDYPATEQQRQWLAELSSRVWFLNTTEEAARMGNPIFSNIMLIGALAGTGELPLEQEGFAAVIAQWLPADKVEMNLVAFEKGRSMTAEGQQGCRP